jgi:hypothetical protein
MIEDFLGFVTRLESQKAALVLGIYCSPHRNSNDHGTILFCRIDSPLD